MTAASDDIAAAWTNGTEALYSPCRRRGPVSGYQQQHRRRRRLRRLLRCRPRRSDVDCDDDDRDDFDFDTDDVRK